MKYDHANDVWQRIILIPLLLGLVRSGKMISVTKWKKLTSDEQSSLILSNHELIGGEK